MMIDVGVLGSPPFEADISQAEVAAAANEDLAALQRERDRGRSVTAMALGATAILARLLAQGSHSRCGFAGRIRRHDHCDRSHACASLRLPKIDGFHAGRRRYQTLRGNQRHLHDAFRARHRGFESRLPPNTQQCRCGDLRHGCRGTGPRPRREARNCGDHVWRHHALRHRSAAHPRGERLRSSGLSCYGHRRPGDGAVDRRRRNSSCSRPDDHGTRRRTGGRCHERRAAPAGSSRPQGHSPAGLPGRDRHGEFRACRNSARPSSEAASSTFTTPPSL